MTTRAKLEDQAGKLAERMLSILEGGHPDNVKTWITHRTPGEVQAVALALGASYLRLEKELEAVEKSVSPLKKQARMLDVANEQLFNERRKLTERVQRLEQQAVELMDINKQQASRIRQLRQQVEGVKDAA